MRPANRVKTCSRGPRKFALIYSYETVPAPVMMRACERNAADAVQFVHESAQGLDQLPRRVRLAARFLDLVPGWADDVPTGAEGSQSLTIGVASLGVPREVVKRMSIVHHLHGAIAAQAG